ncbi:MAG: hypothetical protein IJM59_07580 [Proteobacteria bacterium]|nr:hypothetical protein [Pseudomonadota bacterium]
MTTDKTSFQIDIRYHEDSAGTAEIQALADELQKRGHRVSVKRTLSKNSIVRDITRQARDIKGLAENMIDAAGNSMQKLRDMVEPFVKPADREKHPEKPEQPAKEGFDDIGPAASAAPAAAGAAEDENRAVVVTSPDSLDDMEPGVMRIGFMPRTALDSTWQPSMLDAMVIPHASFRPYLEYIHWNAGQIFEGGYLALSKDCPSMTHEDALKRFNLSSENGPVVLIMASEFDDLQTLMIQLSLIKLPMQIFFYHAGDAYKADQLRMLAQKYSINARMFGRVESLPDYLAMADVAVVHAKDRNGELLQNAGVPTIYVIGSETPARLNFLLHEHAAIAVPQLIKVSAALAQIVPDPSVRQTYRQPAEEIAKLASIERCADAIEAALAKKKEIVPDASKRAVSADGFETIGNMPMPMANQNILMPQAAPQMPFETVAPAAPVMPAQPVPGMIVPPATIPMVAPVPAPAPAVPFLTPGIGARSKAEIKDEYTNLVMAEKSLDKSLDAASAEVQKWELRLDLARQNNREDLIASAMASLQNAKTQEMSLLQQKDQIQQQKAILKQSARLVSNQGAVPDKFAIQAGVEDELFGPSKEEIATEKEFENLQKNMALQQLKNNMGRR